MNKGPIELSTLLSALPGTGVLDLILRCLLCVAVVLHGPFRSSPVACVDPSGTVQLLGAVPLFRPSSHWQTSFVSTMTCDSNSYLETYCSDPVLLYTLYGGEKLSFPPVTSSLA